MKEFTPEYIQELKDIVKSGDIDKARAELKDLHPADIAELFQELDITEAEFLLNLLDADIAGDVLMEIDEDDRKRLLANMPNETIAKQYLEHLDSDDAVDLIQELDEKDREEVISHLDDVEQAGDIIDLLKYGDDPAGGLLGTGMLCLQQNSSMTEWR